MVPGGALGLASRSSIPADIPIVHSLAPRPPMLWFASQTAPPV
jgi:hypothetical protein